MVCQFVSAEIRVFVGKAMEAMDVVDEWQIGGSPEWSVVLLYMG